MTLALCRALDFVQTKQLRDRTVDLAALDLFFDAGAQVVFEDQDIETAQRFLDGKRKVEDVHAVPVFLDLVLQRLHLAGDDLETSKRLLAVLVVHQCSSLPFIGYPPILLWMVHTVNGEPGRVECDKVIAIGAQAIIAPPSTPILDTRLPDAMSQQNATDAADDAAPAEARGQRPPVEPVSDDDNDSLSALRQSNDLLAGQKHILEMLATGASLAAVLGALASLIEASSPGVVTSILVRDLGTDQFSFGVAPELAGTYIETLAHASILPPYLGPCGRATHLGEAVLIPDIGTDDRWPAEWRELATSLGLRACYSAPIRGSTGEVLGSFGFYRRERGDPRPADRSLLEVATHMAAIAIEHRQIQDQRRLSEESAARLASIVDWSEDAIVSKDLRGIVRTWNKAAERMFGYSANEAIGKPIAELIIPPDRLEEEDEILRLIGRGEPIEHFETVRRRKDGSSIGISVTISPLKQGGRVVGASKIARDISERQRREAAVAEDVEALEQLQQFSAEIIHEDDAGAFYERILDAAIGLMHADMASMQVLDRPAGELDLVAWRGFHPVAAAFWQRVSAGSTTSCGEALARNQRVVVADAESYPSIQGTQDQKMYRLSGIRAMQSTPLISRRGNPLGMLSTHWRVSHTPGAAELSRFDVLARQAADLIERKQTEDALRQSSRMKDELLGLISHEFRNPLATIVGNVGLLYRGVDLDEQTHDALIGDLHRDSLRLKSLIENMLILSRAGSSEGLLEPVLLQRLLPAVIATPGGHASGTIALLIDDGLPPVLASPPYLEQVIENLVSNARKYGADGAPIEIEVRKAADRVRIVVRDRGDVYSDAEVAEFFEPFYRSAANRNRVAGLGLGMSVCRRLVEIQGGELIATPRDGGGIEASFTLQALPDDEV